MSNTASRILCLVLLCMLCGCPQEKTAPSAPADPAPAEPAPASKPQPPREVAKASAQALGGRLMKRLQEALATEGFDGGIRVCSKEAAELTAAVAAEQGVKLGRTSFRLRNPANTPPAWAEEWVAARVEEPRFSEPQGGGLRALLPIRLQPLCVNCHGPSEDLKPEVKAAIAENYPEDQATGFRAGDLRGWFWVEVPAAE